MSQFNRNPLHILFILTQDLQSPSGLGRYYPMAKELVRLGHRVQIIALHGNFDGQNQKKVEQNGVSVIYAGQMHVLKRENQKEYFSPLRLLSITTRSTWALTRTALRFPADIVHIGKPHPMNSLAGLIAGLNGRKTVFLDYDDYEVASNRLTHFWQRSALAICERFVPRMVDHITTHSHFLRETLINAGIRAEKISYISNGIDQDRFTRTDPAKVNTLKTNFNLNGKQIVAYIGSLSLTNHPVDLLIDAFKLVSLEREDTVLLLVGGGEDYELLKSRVKELALEQSVRFSGRVSPEDVPLYYSMADVTVDPVYDNLAARGRVPLKLFESWSTGVPFITGDVGDRKRLLGDPPAGLLIKPGDARSLADSILKLLDDHTLANLLIERGKDCIQQYTWSNLAHKLEEIYYQIHAETPLHAEITNR